LRRKLPDLRRASAQGGDIVIVDDLGSHKGKPVWRAIGAAGAKLFFLPPYSPDLNTIEKAFAKLKTCSERLPSRTAEDYFASAGYASM
jgi:transposase